MKSPSLVMLAWVSLLAALGHKGHHNNKLELVSYFGFQALCLAAGVMEAGTAESGNPVRGLRVARYAATVAGVWYMALLIYLSWSAP